MAFFCSFDCSGVSLLVWVVWDFRSTSIVLFLNSSFIRIIEFPLIIYDNLRIWSHLVDIFLLFEIVNLWIVYLLRSCKLIIIIIIKLRKFIKFLIRLRFFRILLRISLFIKTSLVLNGVLLFLSIFFSLNFFLSIGIL